jgi:hypothetical protein
MVIVDMIVPPSDFTAAPIILTADPGFYRDILPQVLARVECEIALLKGGQ